MSYPDDNAFTDCVIAAHADFVITENHHFNLLANAGYKPQPITPSAFINRYLGLYFQPKCWGFDPSIRV